MAGPPLPAPTSVQDHRDRADRYAEQLLAVEQAAVRAVTVRLAVTLAAVRRESAGRVLMARTPQQLDQATTALARDLEAHVLPLLDDQRLLPGVLEQAQRAIDTAAVYTLGDPNRYVDLRPEQEAARAMKSAAAAARAEIRTAAAQMEKATTAIHVQAALTVADRSVRAVATGAEYAVNSAGNSVPRRTIQPGQKLVWVAERDACLVCLALSGDVIDPFEGEAFDEFATFGDTSPPSVWPPGMPLTGPPRHPHCRCIVQVWAGTANRAVADWPNRLRHEALRSVARGFSLPSESNASRVRAAERILRSGQAGQLPKSVQAYAREAVALGRFQSRDLPRYPPAKPTRVP